MPEVSVALTSDNSVIGRPVLYEIVKRFGVKPNIQAASITDTKVFITVRIQGDSEALVDALRWLLGEIVAVRGQVNTFVAERRDPGSGCTRTVSADDYAAAWLRFASGARATMTVSLVEAERLHRLTIAGSAGGARLDEQQPLRFGSGDGSGDGETKVVEVADDLQSCAELQIPNSDWARSFLRLARRVVAAIEAGETRVDGLADFEDGHRNQQILDAIRRSSVDESWVEIT